MEAMGWKHGRHTCKEQREFGIAESVEVWGRTGDQRCHQRPGHLGLKVHWEGSGFHSERNGEPLQGFELT